MSLKIWSSIPLEILEKEINDIDVDKNSFELLAHNRDYEQAQVLLGVPDALMSNNTYPDELKWIQLVAVDYSGLKVDENIVITNMKGVFAKHIAESILGSILAYYRGLFKSVKYQAKKDWKRWPMRLSMDSLVEKKIVILGAGAICNALLPLIEKFECSVTIYRKKSEQVSGFKIINNKDELLGEVGQADVIINALPLNDETKNFVDTKFISQMNSKALYINVGRGLTNDEEALVEALKAQKIASAVLDVTHEEPIEAKSKLWDVDNLFLTQHTMGGSHEELKLKSRFFTQNLKRFLTQQPMENVIRP